MGSLRTDRPAKNDDVRFIFFKTDDAPEAAGIREKKDDVNNKNGLVRCVFLPEVGADEIQVT